MKSLIVSDNQAQTWLIITINDTSIGDLPLIVTISDTCKNQTKRLDFDNTINLSNLIVNLGIGRKRSTTSSRGMTERLVVEAVSKSFFVPPERREVQVSHS